MPVIERKLNDMNALVNEMLETARLEEGMTRLDRQRQPMRAILAAATSAIQPQLTAAHRLNANLPSEDVLVDVDAGRIETVLRNLLDNAIKFSPDGGEVDCHTQVRDGGVRIRRRPWTWNPRRADAPTLHAIQPAGDAAEQSYLGNGLGTLSVA